MRLEINLNGPGGTVFSVIGVVGNALQKNVSRDAKETFKERVMKECITYEGVLDFCVTYCEPFDITVIYKGRYE